MHIIIEIQKKKVLSKKKKKKMVLILTYNVNENILYNYLQNTETSPNPGLSTDIIVPLHSEQLFLPGLNLFYHSKQSVTITQEPVLKMSMITITASIGDNTIGEMSFSFTVNDKTITTNTSKISAYVSSCSGIFAPFLNGNVIIEFKKSLDRTIYIFSP